MQLLLLGESGASARYLTGTFARAGIEFRHVEARQALERLDADWDVVLFSDYPAGQLGSEAAASIVQRVRDGAGLVMIGGWTSFNGKGEGYRGTAIADLLPVTCSEGDDRRNVHSGLWLEALQPEHPVLASLDFAAPPVLCGYNAVTPAAGATLLAQGRSVQFRDGRPQRGPAVPLLAVQQVGSGRALAYASDLVPHWCGGTVDWGAERVALPGGAEVGAGYCTFLLNMVRWVGGETA
ncbi:MAG TPA: glutamine amidotransferase [Chloroflexota bacterium]|nr:glutamine amidotransferase [Chloroflexota bacterium]